MRIVVPGNTPEEMLDYGMMLLNKGDAEQAALVFFQLQQSKLAGIITQLMQVAKDGQRRQGEMIGRLLAEARQKFEAAIVSNTGRERQRDPAVLCDEAIVLF